MALDAGHLGGLAMDVGRAPDQRPSPELAARPGVVATPHLGGLTPENADAQAYSSVEQIAAMLAARSHRDPSTPTRPIVCGCGGTADVPVRCVRHAHARLRQPLPCVACCDAVPARTRPSTTIGRCRRRSDCNGSSWCSPRRTGSTTPARSTPPPGSATPPDSSWWSTRPSPTRNWNGTPRSEHAAPGSTCCRAAPSAGKRWQRSPSGSSRTAGTSNSRWTAISCPGDSTSCSPSPARWSSTTSVGSCPRPRPTRRRSERCSHCSTPAGAG